MLARTVGSVRMGVTQAVTVADLPYLLEIGEPPPSSRPVGAA
jgi:hypothetical protein